MIIGAAYKKDIDDFRESPAIDVIKLLEIAGSEVSYYDPYISKINYNNVKLDSLKNLNSKIIRNFDACAILTEHSNIDYNLIENNIKLIIDTRNILKHSKSKHIKRLGEG